MDHSWILSSTNCRQMPARKVSCVCPCVCKGRRTLHVECGVWHGTVLSGEQACPFLLQEWDCDLGSAYKCALSCLAWISSVLGLLSAGSITSALGHLSIGSPRHWVFLSTESRQCFLQRQFSQRGELSNSMQKQSVQSWLIFHAQI